MPVKLLKNFCYNFRWRRTRKI